MSEHTVKLEWQTSETDFSSANYTRNHRLSFDNGNIISASAAPDYLGDSSAIDPEEMLVAALSSCHMLTFLAIASKRSYIVVSYQDNAIGYLEKNSVGKMAITRVDLTPRIIFSGDKQPNHAELGALHEKAHMNCFIANSVQCEINVKS
jgi:organic hydroperoxide reductase OsmC/OhrA